MNAPFQQPYNQGYPPDYYGQGYPPGYYGPGYPQRQGMNPWAAGGLGAAAGGLIGYELVAWQGVVAPAGTPRAVVDQLSGQINALLADPATREKLAALSLEPLPPSTPDSFAAYVKTEVERWA